MANGQCIVRDGWYARFVYIVFMHECVEIEMIAPSQHKLAQCMKIWFYHTAII